MKPEVNILEILVLDKTKLVLYNFLSVCNILLPSSCVPTAIQLPQLCWVVKAKKEFTSATRKVQLYIYAINK